MRKILLFALVSIVMTACSEKNSPTDNSYYVRYSLYTASIISKVTYADVNVIKTETLPVKQTSWTVTVGPVKKGFRAYVKTEEYTANAKIEVCRNSEPFALKASGKDSVSYTIDF